GRGGADLRLKSSLATKGPSETEVTTTSRVNITGILAQMGRGMVQDVGDQIFQAFTQRVRAELEAPPQSTEVRPAATPVPPSRPEPLDMGTHRAVRQPES